MEWLKGESDRQLFFSKLGGKIPVDASQTSPVNTGPSSYKVTLDSILDTVEPATGVAAVQQFPDIYSQFETIFRSHPPPPVLFIPAALHQTTRGWNDVDWNVRPLNPAGTHLLPVFPNNSSKKRTCSCESSFVVSTGSLFYHHQVILGDWGLNLLKKIK